MTENMKKFLEAVSQNYELREKLNGMSKEDILAAAKALGIDLAEEDFASAENEINDDELETVAGGGKCYCIVGGGGTKEGNDGVCACVLHGHGTYTRYGTEQIRCLCPGAGHGGSFE